MTQQDKKTFFHYIMPPKSAAERLTETMVRHEEMKHKLEEVQREVEQEEAEQVRKEHKKKEREKKECREHDQCDAE